MTDSNDYNAKLRQQIDQYREVENIHDLPPIFHYWAGRYLAPPLNRLFGTADPVQIFANTFAECASGGESRFLSIGSGDCSIEVDIATRLKKEGLDFLLECTELSPVLLERGREAAKAAGVAHLLVFTEVDINHWQPSETYAAVMAHHSLHHIVRLEHVFEQVHEAMAKDARFVISDIIGRNGHMRWPEAQRLVEAIWKTLPERKKYNQQLRRLEDEFVNWDCSGEGFEGIRAQDIMPLLVERFDFLKLMAFGNLTDVFIDRAFGHNYDADAAADREFVDRLHAANELLIDLGVLKPTMIIATMARKHAAESEPECYRGWGPAFCVRRTHDSLDRSGEMGARLARTSAVATESGQRSDSEGPETDPSNLREQLALARETLEEARDAQRRAEGQLTELRRSTSWRVTAPMRWLKTRLRSTRV
ncbi:hypothetical protein CKO31_16910 [Thiohalocapsa halophila]|uniref:Class I SAM-dependent methyltransferase n=1 Tax=Thiohalocapsa halophila TaxID=69359 RepID=A0ABS1CKG4_9GAMM|nr:class I SAM-dependent methyltransferase [Thiohalocapsa halophila]MBK1632387.1 hypothetical protein [Thiohalocapsa halophila]